VAIDKRSLTCARAGPEFLALHCARHSYCCLCLLGLWRSRFSFFCCMPEDARSMGEESPEGQQQRPRKRDGKYIPERRAHAKQRPKNRMSNYKTKVFLGLFGWRCYVCSNTLLRRNMKHPAALLCLSAPPRALTHSTQYRAMPPHTLF
jgi:hypothetical protein